MAAGAEEPKKKPDSGRVGVCRRTMTEVSESESNEEERPVFCPYNRESLVASEARIAEEEAKKSELKKKREEGEVGCGFRFLFPISCIISSISFVRCFIVSSLFHRFIRNQLERTVSELASSSIPLSMCTSDEKLLLHLGHLDELG